MTELEPAAVVITHDPRCERFADRFVRVEDGRIQAVDSRLATKGALP